MPDDRLDALHRYEQMLRYELAIQDAEAHLLKFAQFTSPVARAMDDPGQSTFLPARHLAVLADLMESVERGETRKAIINMPPRHGKSELATKKAAAWISGRNPDKELLIATYGENFAKDFKKDVAEIIGSQRFRQVFPEYFLLRNGDDRLLNMMGKHLFFLGRRSPTTGRGGDFILVDDPTKDDKEVRSVIWRDDIWEWFTQTLLSRRHTDKAPVMVTMCMTGDTPVLMADGRDRPLRSVRPGDRIATYEDGRITTSRVLGWANQGPDQVFRIRMKSGATVRANARHPFLVSDHGRLEWRRTAALRRGTSILRATGANTAVLCAPLRAAASRPSAAASAIATTARRAGRKATVLLRSIRDHVAMLASALVTGSASLNSMLCSRSRVAYAPCASSPRATMFAPIGGTSSASITATRPGGCGGSSATTAISRSAMGRPLPCCAPLLDTFSVTLDEVESIDPAGVEDVFDLQVERTANFIANGLVSHNTRWHEDDIVGRITDKTNPKYSKEFSEGWEIINLPALAEENDQMGRVTGEALWPSRFGVTYLEEMRAANPVAFSSLYQGDPTPQDGVFYQQSDLHTYDRGELPEGLRMHGASDHAVSTTTAADPSCLGIFGIDDAGTAWVLPDLVWRKLPADEAVEEMIRQMRTYRPLWWYAERGHISRAIGPFLKKRMQEEGVHTPIVEDQPVVDKLQRAHSARARCAQGRIRFPSYAAWWPRAKVELLKFPNGRHDDFVDFLSIIGMKLTTHVRGYRETTRKEPEPGTWGALKAQWTAEDHEKKARAARAGW